MRLLLLYVLLLKGSRADTLPPVTVYAGKSVTLRSGADPEWNLMSITWSIWTNTTWIATYLKNKENLNHFYKYRNRLQLNTSTGDLTLSNVSSADELEYTVDLFNSENHNKVNKIKLNIKQHLQQPVIQSIVKPADDFCFLYLHCSSPDSGVSLSWENNPHFQTSKDTKNVLLVLLNKTKSAAEFTCVSRKNRDNATKTVSLKCEDSLLPVTTTTSAPLDNTKQISRDPIFLVPGFFLGAITMLFVMYLKRRRSYLVT
ncbi:CD48 antigen [Eucyclogobius newberryi]|uniref:CD48 antigen n=1 Tax=Eucyclogobius newberryi TaxID=166745 RepID=UPI003B58D216